MYDNRIKDAAAGCWLPSPFIDYRLPHRVVVFFTGNEVKSVTSCLMMTMTMTLRQAMATATATATATAPQTGKLWKNRKGEN